MEIPPKKNTWIESVKFCEDFKKSQQLRNCNNCGANSYIRNRCEYCGTQIENASGIVTIVSEIERKKPEPPASRFTKY